MKTAQDIIVKPIITERTSMDASEGRYAFVVAKTATKPEIRQAVEQLFNVKVLAVNTANYSGKTKRVGVHIGKTAAWKKAVVKIDMEPQESSFLVKGGKASTSSKKYKTAIEEFGFIQ